MPCLRPGQCAVEYNVPVRAYSQDNVQGWKMTRFDDIAEEAARNYWAISSKLTVRAIIRAAIVKGIELALKQEVSEAMREAGEKRLDAGIDAEFIYQAMRAVQLAEFNEEMK